MNESVTDYSNLTNPEKRREICQRLSINAVSEPYWNILSHQTLRSLVGYLLGEYPDSDSDRKEMKHKVAVECDLSDYNSWLRDNPDSDRPFKTEELETILQTMDETDDQRDWLDLSRDRDGENNG